MGLNLFRNSVCGCNWNLYRKEPVVEYIPSCSPNPDPTNFNILDVKIVNRFAIVLVEYPNCTNFEGKKVLVFEDVSESEIRDMKSIDPHFCDLGHKSVVARFEPTEQGIRYANLFCNAARSFL